MSAIARYFKAKWSICFLGYDKTPSDLTDELIQEGIEVGFSEQLNPKDLVADLYVFTPAIPKKSPSFCCDRGCW